MNISEKNYLSDLGTLLRENAMRAKADASKAKNLDDGLFQKGRQMAYYEVISLMQQQAEAFGIPLTDINLEGLDPEKDVLQSELGSDRSK